MVRTSSTPGPHAGLTVHDLLGARPEPALEGPRGCSWVSLYYARRDIPGFCNRSMRKHRPAGRIVTALATRDALWARGRS